MKNIEIFIKLILTIAISLLTFSACDRPRPQGDDIDHGVESNSSQGEYHEEGHQEDEEGIHLTKDQINTIGVEFGKLISIKINDFISATGTLGLPPDSYSSVSAKASGFIKDSKKYVEGRYVKKGSVIAYLENPEFIRQQQEYLEVSAELTFLKQELDRQQNLVQANAGVIKNVQKKESEVGMKTATLSGVAKQLAYLGINVDNLSPDNIIDRISIIAPMSGFITSINIHNGMYVSPEMVLMDIISEAHLHLELDVFEKDISQLKENQKISYTVPALGDKVYEAEVHIIGKVFNTENKTVRIHGHLENEHPQFIKDLFVEAKIWLNDQTVQALPDKAIIKDGAASYIYVANVEQEGDDVKFDPIMVIPGTTDNGYTSVKLIDTIPDGVEIVIQGAYYVYAQSKAGGLEHDH